MSEPVGLNDDEHALLRAEAARVRSMKKWDEKIQALRETVSKNCRHAQTTPFRWEHDDGYGTQSKHEGLRCVFCLKVNRWPQVSCSQQWDQEYYSSSER